MEEGTGVPNQKPRRGALSHALRRAPGLGDGKVVSAAGCSPPDVERGWGGIPVQQLLGQAPPAATGDGSGSGTRPGDQHLASRGIVTASL